MKKLGRLSLAFLFVLGATASLFAKGSNPTLPAPTGVVASIACDGSIDAQWNSVSGAAKYSVEVTAEYDSTIIPCFFSPTNTIPTVVCNPVLCTPDTTIVFSFGSFTNSITIDGANFLEDFGNGPIPPCVFDSVRVKALNPPQKRGGSQNNPFSDPATPKNDCI